MKRALRITMGTAATVATAAVVWFWALRPLGFAAYLSFTEATDTEIGMLWCIIAGGVVYKFIRGRRLRPRFGGMNILRRSSWRFDLLAVAFIWVFMFDLTQFTGCRCWYGAWDRFQGTAAELVLGI